jgi:hypothetical protein
VKLIDFTTWQALIDLKVRMGLDPSALGKLEVLVDPGRLTAEEIEKLISPDGIELPSLDALKVLDDGTLAYKDSRVILYIRDVAVFQNRAFEPKFHLSNCRTLQDMRQRNRGERYVVAAGHDGIFKLNLITGNVAKEQQVRLDVCQNCLSSLGYEEFSYKKSQPWRLGIVKNFALEKFFSLFPKSLHVYRPQHTADTAPLNAYSSLFPAISLAVKKVAGFKCQQCRVDLSKPEHQQYLHCHHKNGIKSDNATGNLKAVCLSCHAEEPSHSHMKSLAEYKEFMALRPSLRR